MKSMDASFEDSVSMLLAELNVRLIAQHVRCLDAKELPSTTVGNVIEAGFWMAEDEEDRGRWQSLVQRQPPPSMCHKAASCHLAVATEADAKSGRASIAEGVSAGVSTSVSNLESYNSKVQDSKRTEFFPAITENESLCSDGHNALNITLSNRPSVIHSHVEMALSMKNAFKEKPCFDAFFGCIILVNMLVIAIRSQIDGYKAASEAGMSNAYVDQKVSEIIFLASDHLFCLTFTAELAFRVRLNGIMYIMQPLGFFETILVVLHVIELYILGLVNIRHSANFTVLRITRLFRLLRVMRMIRVFRLFSSLRVLTETIGSCIKSLIWSILLLSLIICSAGLMVSSLARDTIADSSIDFEFRSWLFRHYGTSTKSTYTMFEATLSGCWPNYARILIERESGLWFVFWGAYILIVTFAILSVIRAIFIQETLQNAMGDPDNMIQEHFLKQSAYRKKLVEAFHLIDVEGIGEIPREDFEWVMRIPKVRALMECLDFEVHDAQFVFDMLEEDNDGAVSKEEFLKGIVRLKGGARQLDVLSIQHDCGHLLESVLKLTNAFESVFEVEIANKVDTNKMRRRHTLRGIVS